MKNLWRTAADVAAVALVGALAGVVYAHKAASSGDAVPTTGTTYALVVGISDYADPDASPPCPSATGPDLQFADDDADSFDSALTSIYGIPDGNTTVLKDCAATKTAILDWFDGLGSGEDDDVIVFVSGHGTRVFDFQCDGGTDGDNERMDNAILVNHDADGNGTVDSRSVICDGNLASLMDGVTAARKAVILDISFPSGFNDDFKMAINTLLIPAARGEARETAFPEGDPCDSVPDNASEGGHGLFTCLFVVRGILLDNADNSALNPHAPGTGDGDIPFEEAYDYSVDNAVGFFAQKPGIVDKVTDDFLPGP